MGTRRKVGAGRQPKSIGGRMRKPPPIEALEPRVLLAIFTVNTAADAGIGSLREAIISANAAAGADEIRFDIPGAGPHLINVDGTNGPLPTITEAVFINGYSEPGSRPNALPVGSDGVVLIEVVGAADVADGLRIDAGGTTVSGLSLYGFDNGIRLSGPAASANVIAGNLIGPSASAGFAPGNRIHGITVEFASDNVIGGTSPGDRNVISANQVNGVVIDGVSGPATGNLISGNYIGTDRSGTIALGNGNDGIGLFAASENTIGAPGVSGRNLISANAVVGILISGQSASSSRNLIAGNYVGTDASGASALGNGEDGIRVFVASDNTIGGDSPGTRNLISGNGTTGVEILGAFGAILGTASGNVIAGNSIGVDAGGNLGVGNGSGGISIFSGSSNSVGGQAPGLGNLVSGNTGFGVLVDGGILPSASNRISGNLIGVDSTGSAPVSNSGPGVVLQDGATDTTVGGQAGAGNLLSGNLADGLSIEGPRTTGNLVLGNRVGTDSSGLLAIGNGGAGIALRLGTSANTIGGPDAPTRNVVAGNNTDGVQVLGLGTSSNLVAGNFIGVGADGETTIGNRGAGVRVDGASGNAVGGPMAQDVNVISANLGSGIVILGGAGGVLIQGNRIGTDASGTRVVNDDGLPLGNALSGVLLDGDSDGNTLDGNLVSGNVEYGILLDGVSSTNAADGNRIRGNRVGLDITGASALGNGLDGVLIGLGSDNTIGGTSPADANLIAANDGFGVLIFADLLGEGGSGNVVQGNLVGVNASGSPSVGNLSGGVGVFEGRQNSIGGTAPGAGNTIAGNLGNGVVIDGPTATGNPILGNLIAANDGIGIDLGDDGPTPDDPGDTDTGPNNLQNSPDLAGAIVVDADTVQLFGTLDSIPGTDFLLEFFADRLAVSPPNLQGYSLLGRATVTTDGAGLATFAGLSFDSPGPLPGDVRFTATATNTVTGDTSEFSVALDPFLVTNTNDLGAGSLRQAIVNANLVPGPQAIRFDIPGSGVQTISPATALPDVTDPVVIDAYSQPGASPNTNGPGLGTDAILQVELDGSSAPSGTTALVIRSGGSTVRGLVVNGFPGSGIVLASAGNVVEGNFVGTDHTGSFAVPNQVDGVVVEGFAGNTIGGLAPAARNLLSGNTSSGAVVRGAGAIGNVVVGNLIGTDATGIRAIGNASSGVNVDFASDNTIGGTTAGARNVISGNLLPGVMIRATGGPPAGGATGNVVAGNFLGTDATGSVALGNGSNGVLVISTSGNTIGGSSPGARNVISGNGGDGILFAITNTDEFSNRNLVASNYIGTDVGGTIALGNGGDGIRLGVNVLGNTIGGSSPGAGNLISGNSGDGVQIRAEFGSLVGSATGNLVSGNLIGTDSGGNAPLPNLGEGISLRQGSTANTIGGPAGSGGNVISANGSLFGAAQVLQGPTPGMDDLSDLLASNLIGGFDDDLVVADRTGFVHLYEGDGIGNFAFSQSIGLPGLSPSILAKSEGATTVYVASDNPGDPLTVLSRNFMAPPTVTSLDINFDRVDGLALGNLDGDFLPDLIVSGDPTGPAGVGLYVLFSAGPTSFGTPVPLATGFTPSDQAFAFLGFDPDTSGSEAGVVALREDTDELFFFPSNGDGTFDPVQTFATGDSPVALAVGDLTGDFLSEIAVANAGDDRVTTLIQSSLGIFVPGPSRDVGLNPEAIAFGDFDGDGLADIATANQSAGTVSVLRRLPNNALRTAETVPVGLGPAALATVDIFDPTSSAFRSTLAVLNETGETVSVLNSRQPPASGILIESAPGNRAVGNTIGLGADGQTSIGNLGSGIRVEDAPDTTIGGLSPALANVISANEGSGIEVSGPASTGLRLLGNRVGTNAPGTASRGNFRSGVRIVGDVSGAVVRDNLLSGNFNHGLFLDGQFDDDFTAVLAARGTLIRGNRVGTDASGTSPLANTVDGIHLRFSRDTTVGGVASGQGNLISGNVDHGLSLIGTASFPGNASGTLVQGNLVGLDASGAVVLGNGEEGLYFVNSPDNTVGGVADGAANVISGNGDDGIAIRGPFPGGESQPALQSSGNRILGNFIGTNADLAPGLGNGQDDGVLAAGIFLAHAPDNVVSGNAIRHNIGRGMLISRSATTGNVVVGNDISENTLAGVRVHNNASLNTIGGVGPGSGNVIRANGGNGVELAVGDSEGNPNLPPPFGIAILGNSISRNVGLGIDLGADGPTANDPGDPDVGPNASQNAPALSSVGSATEPGRILVSGTLDSIPNRSYRVEFFLTPPEPDGFPEGRTFLGAVSVSTDATGLASFSAPLSFPVGDPGTLITATATDPIGNTSEFSPGVEVPTDLTITKTAPESVVLGQELAYTLIVSNVGLVTASGVVVSDPLPDGFQFVEVTSNLGTASEEGGLVLVDIDSLDPGQSASVTIVGIASASGSLTNTATVTSKTPDEDPDTNSSTATTTVLAEPSFVVLNPNDDGPNSLRDIIRLANAFPGVDTITFDIPAELGTTIRPLSPLPRITDTVILDANTQPVGRVELDGSLAGPRTDGLVVDAGGTLITGLSINRFSGSGVVLVGLGGNQVVGNVLGSDPDAMLDLGNGDDGVTVIDSPDNLFQGNVFSANRDNGIEVNGPGSTGNRILGNLIGTTGDGQAMLGNSNAGILALQGASDTTIGGPNPGDGNVLSANRTAGIALLGTIRGQIQAGQEGGSGSSTGTLILGNTIGASLGAEGVLANGLAGILISESSHNTLGGSSGGETNVIAGGHAPGILILGRDAERNVVLGNAIGLRPSDSLPLPGTGIGLAIEYEAHSNFIGGTAPGEGNTIAASSAAGIQVANAAFDNIVQGNTIGLVGQAPGNGVGVLIRSASWWNTILGNRIAGNTFGVIIDSAASSNLILGNAIGAGDGDGVGNLDTGLILRDAPGNTVGGIAPGGGNVISGNGLGLLIEGPMATGNLVVNNAIGLDVAGRVPVPNTSNGVLILNAPGNTIGGLDPIQRNLISGNGAVGLQLRGPLASGNLVAGNQVGTRLGEQTAAPNGLTGIYVDNAPGNTIGGVEPGAGNVVSGNGVVDLQVTGTYASGNLMAGNLVGTGPRGVGSLEGASTGIYLEGAPGNTIGGTTPQARNLVSGHRFAGIHLFGPDSSGNLILGNFIGTDESGTRAVGNEHGITIDGSPSNTIGGTGPGAGNLISGNLLGLVIANSGGTRNVVIGNAIGTDASGERALPNRSGGVFLNAAPGNTIGGPTPESGNVISGNGGVGLQAFNLDATANVIAANMIGVDRTTSRPIPNGEGGVYLNNAPGNTVGGAAGGPGNVVSGNFGSGVVISGEGALDNVVAGNIIGTPRAGDPPIFGNQVGLFVTGVPGLRPMPTPPEQSNVIRGNRAANTLVVGNSGPLVVDGTSLRDASGAISSVVVTFSEPLNRPRAEQVRNYRVDLGRNGNLGQVPVASASFDETDNTVTLRLSRPIAADAPFRLVIVSRPPVGPTNRLGLALDGNNDGDPGDNFVGLFEGGELVRGTGQGRSANAAVSAPAVDSIFGTGGLRVARRRP